MSDRPRFLRHILIVILVLSSAACGSSGDEGAQETEELIIPTSTPLTVSQPQATPDSAEPTVENTQTLRIWWPEALAPLDRSEVTAILNSQIESFVINEDIPTEIDFRLKRSENVGGILETLRAGITVAPDAMPDVTLMRRDNLVLAANQGLIYAIEEQVPTVIIGDLYDVLIELGRVDGRMYGLPYTAVTFISAYSELTHVSDESPVQMDRLIQANADWIFPAGNVSTMGSILLAQYLDAGGRLPDSSLSGPDYTALEAVYTFYQDALNAGIITDDTVAFSTLDAYQFGLPDQLVVINTDRYFSLLGDEEVIHIVSLPSMTGEAIGTVNGWVWVITTSDRDQQELALRFVTWLMEPERQLAFVEALGTLPSRQTTLRAYDNLTDTNVNVLDQVLGGGIITPGDGTTGAFTRAMVNGLLLILNGEGTVEEALDLVQAQFSP